MKVGDRVFIHNPHFVTTWGEVVRVTDNEIEIWVLNGEYPLRITKEPPKTPRADYNEAIEWFKENRKWIDE